MELRTTEYPLLHPRTSDAVRVISWNVHYGSDESHGDDIMKALQSFDCDVLLLYELWADLKLPERIHALGYGGVYVEANYRRVFIPIGGGIALFSRFAIEDIRIVETIADGLLSVRRYYIEARLRVSSTFSLTVGMTHHSLPFEVGFSGACDVLYREVAKHTERFLFLGDLNALPNFKIVQKLRSRLAHLGPPLHFPSHPTSRWVKRLAFPRRLDYAFATHDVKDMLVGEARFGESHPSDHNPVLVHLRTNK